MVNHNLRLETVSLPKSRIDYLDEDVAYLLGLIIARGQFSETRDVKRITIEYPFRNLEVQGITKSYNQRNELLAGVNASRERINELTDTSIQTNPTDNSVILTITAYRNTMFWRDLRLITNGKNSYSEFEIPDVILSDTRSVKREFLRGYVDVAGSVRQGNYDQRGKQRVYIDVMNANWKLPVQICHLLQDHLNIPVQTIDYGHPNTRDPERKEYDASHEGAWSREHQLKVYCEDFLPVGFYMPHKMEILKELAKYNKERYRGAGFCEPPKTIHGTKPEHPEERSKKLPKELRGKHYNAYWQICGDLGCPRQPKCLPKFKPYMDSIQSTFEG